MDPNVEQFMSITSSNEQVAHGFLEISGGDLMQAVQLYFENPDLQSSFTSTATNAPAASSQHQPPVTSSSSRTASGSRPAHRTGREDASGVIHIDSDDEDLPNADDNDDDFVIPDDDDDDIQAVARNAQEEEDAAMARRLQEEMYGQNPAGDEGVRAPISQTMDTLVGPDSAWGADDRDSAILEQLRRRPQPRVPRNPFGQSVWDDPSAQPPVAPAATSSRSQRLADLFRPPHDLIFHGSWDDAREDGKEEKKWLLVNLQDMSNFNCQALNRDHWKAAQMQSLIREHFIFLQYEKHDPHGEAYTTFYFPNQAAENPDNYPHVSIVDPRTGEQVKVWSGMPFPNVEEFHSDLVEFLDRYSLAANSKNPVPKSKPKEKPVDFSRLTEEEMMQMAMQNSLDANGGTSKPSVQDPDELTKLPGAGEKGKEVATEAPVASASPFSQISSSNPHEEPEPNPTTTTRIQFRHPAGRIIRRFGVDESVRRIYEWLKATPLEGKEGVEFELKPVPAGSDLINSLDKTVAEAGLKQGTVMIEFIDPDE